MEENKVIEDRDLPKTDTCYCCKKEKEGTYIFKDGKSDEARWVCNDCNYLK